MLRNHLHKLFWLVCSLAISQAASAEIRIHAPSDPPFREIAASKETLAQIRQGGYVLYMRHGYTDNTRPDKEDQIDLANCATQRVLSDPGRKLMREIGESIRTAGIPIGEILVSPMCRTRESAELAFGKSFRIEPLLMYWTRMTPETKMPRLEELQRLLSTPVKKGSNRVLLAHAPNLNDLIGLFVKPEGSMIIFAPKGTDGYEYVATIYPGMWSGLLN